MNRTRIPNNLPELRQELQLARDACAAHGIPLIPPTRMWVADPSFDWYCKWRNLRPIEIKIREQDIRKRPGRKKKADAGQNKVEASLSNEVPEGTTLIVPTHDEESEAADTE